MDSEASSASALSLTEGCEIKTASSVYSFIKYVGEGVFGKVALLKDLHDDKTVVVKILKRHLTAYVKREVAILKAINALGPDRINVVKFHDYLDFAGHDGLVFEQLYIPLDELLRRRDYWPLSPSEIRPIATQLLVALDALRRLRILHTDIKPDNIMLVSGEDQPFQVKLIDFGNAIYATNARPGIEVQALSYRAPEVFLGLKFNEAVDMWGLACVLAYLYLAAHLFPYGSHYLTIKAMVELLGVPKDHQLRTGLYARSYFTEEAGDPKKWRLLIPAEYTALNNLPVDDCTADNQLPGGLDDLVDIHPDQEESGLEDRRAFVELLKGMLHLDEAQRLSPSQALKHPFIRKVPLGLHSDSGVDLNEFEGPSESQRPDCQPSACSWESTGVSSTQQGVYRLDSTEGPLDWYSSQEGSPAPGKTSSNTLSCINLLLSSEEAKVPSEGGDTIGDAVGRLSSPNTRESLSEPAATESPSSPPDTSYCQEEDDAAASSPDAECPPSAHNGRLRKALKRVRRFFGRIGSLFCCLRPDVEE